MQPAYPDRDLLEQAKTWVGKSVAIRGLGLSAADVLRVLTLGLGGTFKDGRYHRSGNEPSRIVPFSLDGQPSGPKPKNAELDHTASETAAFRGTGSFERITFGNADYARAIQEKLLREISAPVLDFDQLEPTRLLR